MSASYDLGVAVPDTHLPDFGGGPSFQRIFVPVRSPAESAEALAAAVTIRRKLEPDPAHPRYFVTEPGCGVRFLPSGRPPAAVETTSLTSRSTSSRG